MTALSYRIRCIVLTLAGVFAVVAGAGADAPPATHPLNIDDMLAMERIGRVEIAGGGRFIIFEKSGPKEGIADYAIEDPSATGRIYIYDRSKAASPKRLLADFKFPNWIGALSPDGDKLAVYWFEQEHVKAGVVDLATGKLTKFPFNPTFDFQQSAPLWISDEELVYSADTKNGFSPRVDFRRRAALMLSDGWQRAWHGGLSSSVLESHGKEFVPEWRPGSIVKVDAKSGRTTELAEGKYVEMSLSPDHRYLAAGRQGRTLRFRPDSGKETYDVHRLEPRLIDLKAPQEAVSMCEGCQLSGISDFVWGATGHRVGFFARVGDEAWERARFRVFDVDTKSLLEVRHVGLDLASQRETGQQNAPVSAIPFADGALVPARKQADPKADPIFTYKEPTHSVEYRMVSENAAKLGRLDWYFVSPDGSSRAVTSTLSSVDSVTVASDSQGLYFLGGNKVVRVGVNGEVQDAATLDGPGFIYKLDGSFDAGGHALAIEQTAKGGMEVQFFQGTTLQNTVPLDPTIGRPLAEDPKSGVIVFQSASEAGSTVSTVDRDGNVKPVFAFNQHLKLVAPAKQVVIKYVLPGGEAATGCVLLPADAPSGKPLPTIVYAYPVPGGHCEVYWRLGLADSYGPELLTGFGYAVLFPSTPARILRSGNNPVANWGAVVQPAIDEAVKEGYVDKDRLGAFGLSLGGHSVLSLLSQTNVFKAGVAINGAADFFSNYASLGLVRGMLSDDLFAVGHSTLYEGAPEEGAYMGGPPWELAADYAVASPLSHAGSMNTPLMLVATDLDWDYQMTEFDQYYIALLRQGKEATYVRYWGEGHGNKSPANLRDTWQRMHKWYDAHFH